jgi:Predicted redox protein, regulator of disulfide bond formation
VTNPERLFAGGYAARFENALPRMTREAGKPLADDNVHVAKTVAAR